MDAKLLFLHAVSPLHSGTGQGVGVIDLPVAREKATNLPIVPGSTIKGVLRDYFADDPLCMHVFGPETTHASDYAGSAQFSDVRLLLLPVRSLLGTFAWVTSPYVLQRFQRDVSDAGMSGAPAAIPRPVTMADCAIVPTVCKITEQAATVLKVYLEDLDLAATADRTAKEWAEWLAGRIFPNDTEWQATLTGRFCVVHDDALNFLLETATEITARIKLREDVKTVQKGGLWYEEALPVETVLSGLVVTTPVKVTAIEVANLLAKVNNKTLQFGGKATVGRGLCRIWIGS